MRRFIVGLLATIGFVTILAIAGAVLFVVNGPLAPKALPDSMVLSLDLRQVPKEGSSGGGVLRGLLHDDRDLTDTVQLLLAGGRRSARGRPLCRGRRRRCRARPRVQELRDAISRFRGKGKFAIGFAEELGGNGDHFADYYLASALDQIWMQPSGGFQVMGLAVESPFLRGGLDKLGIKVEGGKRWEYKSAPDTFTETGFTRAGEAEPAAAARQPLWPVHR